MKKSKILSITIALVMMLSAIFMVGGMEAFAASVSKPVVSASNTSATAVKISWKKVNNAKQYKVYCSTKKSSGYKAVKTTTSTSYSATGLTCGKTYYFKVEAINGKNKATSAVKSIAVKPVQVKSVKSQKGCTFLKVSWAKSSGATGYEVYSSATKGGKYSKIATVTAVSYKNTGLKFNTTKYYKVRAYKTVSGKKVYGEYSKIANGKTASNHEPSSSWVITKQATCATTGTRTNTCAYCSKKITETIDKNDDHRYVKSTVVATAEHCPYAQYTCSICGDIYNSEIKKHKYSEAVTAPSCTMEGYTTFTCDRDNCGYSYVGDKTDKVPHTYVEVQVKKNCTADPIAVNKCSVCNAYETELDFTPIEGNPQGHSFEENKSTTTQEGYVVPICDVCGEEVIEKTDYTCYIDLTNKTVSVPATAEFKASSTDKSVITKLDLTPNDNTKAYEITGSAENITIDVNADRDMEIKLNGVTITNDAKDCFDIKNKSTKVKEDGTISTPDVDISAKDGTVNNLIATTNGNAIESSCNLVFKGHGTLKMDTVSTSINCVGKIEIKNLTLEIKSRNRGIDTKNEILNDAGLIISTDYSNITINPNATIIINSADDGIRCKNMEITALVEGDVDSVIDITSGSDGIQLEGKKGITANSGDIKINAGKYAFNCKAELIIFNNGVSSANCKGKSGFSK